VKDKVGCHACAEIFMTAPSEAGCLTPTFLIPVILSEARHWRSQWLAQSKDPTPARTSTDPAGGVPNLKASACPESRSKKTQIEVAKISTINNLWAFGLRELC